MLLNIFVNDLEEGIRCTLAKYDDDTKLSGKVEMLERRPILHDDPDRLEERANKNLMEFSKDE